MRFKKEKPRTSTKIFGASFQKNSIRGVEKTPLQKYNRIGEQKMSTKKESDKWVDLTEVKTKVTMSMLIEYYGLKLKKARKEGEYKGYCPLHNGNRNDQFCINLKGGKYGTGMFQCFSCHAKGNVLEFIMKKEEIADPREAGLFVKHEMFPSLLTAKPPNLEEDNTSVSAETGLKKPARKIEQEQIKAVDEPDISEEDDSKEDFPLRPYPFPTPLKDINPKHDYLKKRGLNPETIEYFGIGAYEGKGNMMKGRVVIPLHSAEDADKVKKGTLLGYAGRAIDKNLEPKYLFPKKDELPKGKVVFNLHRVQEVLKKDPRMPLIIVEGFFGCIWLHQCGFPSVCALMTSAMTQHQEELLLAVPTKRYIIMMDGDEAGRKATIDISLRLLLKSQRYVKVVMLPNSKQPDDLSSEEIRKILGG